MSNETNAPLGCHHVAMKVPNFDEVLAFYTNVLGLPVHKTWGAAEKRAALLTMGGGVMLEIFAGAAEKAQPPSTGWLHIAFATRDVDGLIARVQQAGMTVTIEPRDVDLDGTPSPLRARIAFFQGPAGEVVEFFDEKS